MNSDRPDEWVLATTNRGKLAEFRELLPESTIRLADIDPREAPEETGISFVENALIKARHAAGSTGLPALADDSGLCVAALNGAPGVHSARYAGPAASDEENIERLLGALADVQPEQRQAAFYCVIAAVRSPDDPAPVIATGRWPGEITTAPTGTGGFGYDPVFLDPASGLTAAELDAAGKNAVSHRARACRELRRQLAI